MQITNEDEEKFLFIEHKKSVEREKSVQNENENELDTIIEGVSLNIINFKLFLLLLIFCTVDGYTMISNSLVIPEVKKQWNLSKSDASLLGGSIFLGFMIGAITSNIATFRGRRFGFQLGLTISIIGSFLSINGSTAMSIVLYNMLLGIGYGICLPTGMSLVAEICSSEMRSYFLTYIFILFPIGEILACYVAEHYKIFVQNSDDWRKVYFFRFIGILIILPFTFLISESPRYMLTINKNEEAFVLLKDLVGKKNEYLINEKKEIIIDQYKKYLERNNVIDAGSIAEIFRSYKEMFSTNYFFQSVLIFFLWYISSLLYYGFMYILPLILEKIQIGNLIGKNNNNSLSEDKYDNVINSLILSCLFEIPMTIISAFVTNIKCIGRVGALKIGYGLTGVCGVLCYLLPNHITIFFCLYKAACSLHFNSVLLYTSESFPTHLKVTALGLSNFFCRFGGFTSPFIVEKLFKYDALMPLLGLSICSFTGFGISFMLPFETLGMKNF